LQVKIIVFIKKEWKFMILILMLAFIGFELTQLIVAINNGLSDLNSNIANMAKVISDK